MYSKVYIFKQSKSIESNVYMLNYVRLEFLKMSILKLWIKHSAFTHMQTVLAKRQWNCSENNIFLQTFVLMYFSLKTNNADWIFQLKSNHRYFEYLGLKIMKFYFKWTQ